MREDLGDLVATHRYSTSIEERKLVPVLLAVGAGVIITVAGIPIGLVLVVGCGVLAVGMAIGIAVRRARYGGDRIDRHEHGLVVAVGNGAERRVQLDEVGEIVSFHDVWTSLEREPTAATAVSPILALTGNRKPKNIWRHRVRVGDASFEVDRHWTDVEELLGVLRKARRRAILRPLKAKIEAGDSVAFGSIELSPKGVSIPSRTLSWSDYLDISLQQGNVVIRRRPAARFATISMREVPDAEILVELVQFATERRATYR